MSPLFSRRASPLFELPVLNQEYVLGQKLSEVFGSVLDVPFHIQTDLKETPFSRAAPPAP
jgi:hypothetical protein